MQDFENTSYKQRRKPASSFENRADYLDHELSIMSFKRWGINLPFRDYGIEIEDWVPALAATIGKVVMVAAVAGAFAATIPFFQNNPEEAVAFITENVQFELILVGLLFVILFSGILNPRANLAGTHGPMLPLIPVIAMAGGHPLALGIMVGVFGLLLSISKGGSRLVNMTGEGVRGGLLIFLGATGLISQINKFEAWSEGAEKPAISFVIILVTVFIYAYLARVKKRWLAIPLASLVAGILAWVMNAPFEFVTEPSLPSFSPLYWWGENTGWHLGWPELSHFIAVAPFAILAVAMWSPDFLGHRVFQEMNYPKKAKNV